MDLITSENLVCASAVEEVYWKEPLLFSLASYLSPTTPHPQQCSWNVIVVSYRILNRSSLFVADSIE
jgi:hypothetical protein